MKSLTKYIMVGVAGAILATSVILPVRADLLGSVVKGGLIGLAVKQFAGPINDAANKLLGDAGAPAEQATKVVPIISFGSGTYVGAVQVSGPQVHVDQVKAVAQLQTSLMGNKFRITALVPVNTDTPKGSISRVKGVGVSAIIDVKV